MFEGYPRYARYRNLKRGDSGEDVYALQTALKGCSFDPGSQDGSFGKSTETSVIEAQQRYRLDVDGIAGGATQAMLCSRLCLRARATYGLPSGLTYGQTGHESAWRLGNYSPPRSDGRYDAGVAQRNTAFTKPQQGFNAPVSVDALAVHTKTHYDLFRGVPERRRWELAAGAWNAPAFACYLAAREGGDVPRSRQASSISPSARKVFEAYIDSVTALMQL
jgi:peptidoglycan hydrolase-like protein with peptidoglycan-binding domain